MPFLIFQNHDGFSPWSPWGRRRQCQRYPCAPDSSAWPSPCSSLSSTPTAGRFDPGTPLAAERSDHLHKNRQRPFNEWRHAGWSSNTCHHHQHHSPLFTQATSFTTSVCPATVITALPSVDQILAVLSYEPVKILQKRRKKWRWIKRFDLEESGSMGRF